MPDNSESFHIRMKGVPNKCIIDAKDPITGNSISPIELYKKLYDGQVIEFDLAKGMPSFKRNKDFSISTNESFVRKISF